MTKVLAPVMFFGTDEVRNDGVKDFRPTTMSAVKAEMQAEASKQNGTAGDDESPKESALDSAKSNHPSVLESSENPVTADSGLVQSPQGITPEPIQDQTPSPKPVAAHPDLDF